MSHDEFFTDPFHQVVTIVEGFLEIMAGIDMYQGKWKAARAKCLQGQVNQGN